MKEKHNLIFVVEDDISHTILIKYYLKRSGFNNVMFFETEKECLSHMDKKPKILITDYRLKASDGLELIKKAKAIFSDFFSILISGLCHEDIFKDEESSKDINQYIRKGLNSMNEVVNTLNQLILQKNSIKKLEPIADNFSI